MNTQIDRMIKEEYNITDAEYVEYNKLVKSDTYFKLRLLQVLEALLIQHGGTCQCCEEKDSEIERLRLNNGWNR